jgi:hypothetical protein
MLTKRKDFKKKGEFNTNTMVILLTNTIKKIC